MGSGYLIVTRYDVLYRQALASHRYDDNSRPIYGVPWQGHALLPGNGPHYRGIDREPLRGLSFDEAEKLGADQQYTDIATPATNRLATIEVRTGREDGWVTALEDILDVWDQLGEAQARYELLFARERGDAVEIPSACRFLGCDVAYFVTDHFSCICDALFFPRWHGTDPEGVLFARHYALLNRAGLFATNDLALEYLRYYLSFDWTEHVGNFTSIEVYAVDTVAARMA